MKLIDQLITASRYGLNLNKTQAILLLSSKTRRITELAKLLDVSPAAMTGMIDALQMNHIAKRVRSNSKDRRVVNIMLTEKGNEIAQKILSSESAN